MYAETHSRSRTPYTVSGNEKNWSYLNILLCNSIFVRDKEFRNCISLFNCYCYLLTGWLADENVVVQSSSLVNIMYMHVNFDNINFTRFFPPFFFCSLQYNNNNCQKVFYNNNCYISYVEFSPFSLIIFRVFSLDSCQWKLDFGIISHHNSNLYRIEPNNWVWRNLCFGYTIYRYKRNKIKSINETKAHKMSHTLGKLRQNRVKWVKTPWNTDNSPLNEEKAR